MQRLSKGPAGLAMVVLALILVGCAAANGPRPTQGPPGLRASQLRNLSAAPVKGDAAFFAFRPITGAPSAMVFALEDLIKEEAGRRGVNVISVGDPDVTYVVQGHISAVGDPHSALMVYVWDVFDRSGTRIHRFSGQEVAPGSGSDPWSGVTTDIMADAARETIDAIAEWIRP